MKSKVLSLLTVVVLSATIFSGCAEQKKYASKSKIVFFVTVDRHGVGRTEQEFTKYVNNLSPEEQLKEVQHAAYHIKYIKNPSEELQLIAVKKDPDCIRYITNPTKKVRLTAAKEDPCLIEYVENPSEELQLMAVKKDPFHIKYIKNPTKKVQLFAVKKAPYCIVYIKNPTKKVILVAKGKVKADKPDFVISDKNIMIGVENNQIKVFNLTKSFINVSTLSEYIKNDIYNLNISTIPPEGIKTIYSSHDLVLYPQDIDGSITYGFAIQYQKKNKKYSLYKTKSYKTNQLLKQ